MKSCSVILYTQVRESSSVFTGKVKTVLKDFIFG